jgi:hypothetical protein
LKPQRRLYLRGLGRCQQQTHAATNECGATLNHRRVTCWQKRCQIGVTHKALYRVIDPLVVFIPSV